ncbi:MAG: RIP metalloprotease RseP [Clostridiales bacterium]|nr:RIP metalloprotease RseP [Clostridiales bacterium]
MLYNLLSFASVMTTFGYVLLALLILMVMITVHELGHYLVGKLFKFKINEFAIGMGPAIFKRKMKSGEDFSLRIFPFGGFCAFEGEDDDLDDPNAFNNKKPWQRILVLLAGATMNYILALLVIVFSMGVYGQNTFGAGKFIENPNYSGYSLLDDDIILSLKVDGKKTNIYMSTDLISALNHQKKDTVVYAEIIRGGKQIKDVPIKLRSDVECKNLTSVNSTYEALGIGSTMMLSVSSDSKWFKEGDYIKQIVEDKNDIDGIKYNPNGKFLYTYDGFLDCVKDKKAGDEIVAWVGRVGYEVSQQVIIKFDSEWEGVVKKNKTEVLEYFGIKGYDYGYYVTSTPQKLGFFKTIGHSLEYSVKIGGTVLRSLGQLITGALGLNAVGGTVTTIITTTKVLSYGTKYALEIIALIGVNLAVFNLLPIPALDGSRIVFCIIEWIRKKPISRKIEGLIHGIGLILILGFAVLVDLLQFI